MTKLEFERELAKRLSAYPQKEVQDRIRFYTEMIDDRMEAGLTEEAAVRQMGSIDVIASQIAEALPPEKEVKPRKKRSAFEIVLLILGSPIWISLLVAAFAVALSVYVSLWAVVISLWAGFGALVGSAVGGLVGGIVFLCCGLGTPGLATMGASLVCGGLSIFWFYGCKAATWGLVLLTKKTAVGVKNWFVKKEDTL